MKRLTALFTEQTEANLTWILDFARAEGYEVQGIFLRHVKPVMALQYPFVSDLTLTQPPLMEVITEPEELAPSQERLQRCQQRSAAAGVSFAGILLEDASLEDLVFYSGFSDLLVLDAALSLEEFLISPLNATLESLLAKAHCPAIILPKAAQQPQKVLLAYDGHHSTLHAIKMYSYLSGASRHLPTELVMVQTGPEEPQQNRDSLQHWVRERFSNAEIKVLKGKAREELVHYIQEQQGPVVVVMGAFGGDALSRLFHESIASTVLKQTGAALFITHQ